jgi:cytochrome c peroxidase
VALAVNRAQLLFVCVAWTVVAGTGDTAHAHGKHAEATSEPAVLAPGWGRLDFTPPEPGSYALPPLFAAADGAVLDMEGSPTTLHAVYGDTAVLLSFVFASCSDVNGCPLATSVLKRVQQRVGKRPDLAAKLRLVSLSFDPARDTPDVMRRYGEAFGDHAVDWTFLTTASEAELRPILEAYDQSITKEIDAEGQPTGNIAHILRVFLIDAKRRVRNVYTVSFLHADTLVNDVETILEEREPAASPPTEPAAAVTTASRRGPGDVRTGYDRVDYQSRSMALATRRGEPADLFGRTREPPLGLPAIPTPSANPLTPEKIALGRKLFYDRRLSQNGTISCAMCHIPEQGFTNNEIATAVGIEGRTVRRNAPTIYNVAYFERLFHDGRELDLEKQIWGPLLARNEMGNASVAAVVATIAALPDYAGLFESAFGGRGPTEATIGMALASYERTLVSGASGFDRWRFGGDANAISDSARRGFQLFTGDAGCVTCHPVGTGSALFSDGSLHNTGAGYTPPTEEAPEFRRIAVGPGEFLEVESELIARVGDPAPVDLGRFEITQDPADRWHYRTPSLRNVALTAPYMHDGSIATLRGVVEFYDRGGVANPVLDPRIRALGLSSEAIDDLVAFLESLTGSDVDALVGDAFAAPIGDSR